MEKSSRPRLLSKKSNWLLKKDHYFCEEYPPLILSTIYEFDTILKWCYPCNIHFTNPKVKSLVPYLSEKVLTLPFPYNECHSSFAPNHLYDNYFKFLSSRVELQGKKTINATFDVHECINAAKRSFFPDHRCGSCFCIWYLSLVADTPAYGGRRNQSKKT